SMAHPPPTPTLCPYTTLFRSDHVGVEDARRRGHEPRHRGHSAAEGHRVAPERRREDLVLADDAERAPERGVADAMGGREAHRERSEEDTSELQSRENLVCRLL